jgi:hypothetical protein
MTGETNREEFSLDAALAAERDAGEPALVVDVEGFEGPLDLLLALARQQKVDLAKISILALADQYLAFIEEARKLRLELAADYLVMAAWLAYLKSRLLLPDTNAPEGQSAEEMATALALRLRRLEAIREVAGQIFVRPQLDRDRLRFAFGLCATAAAQRACPCARGQAPGLVLGRGARGARAPDRPDIGLGAARRISHLVRGRAVVRADGVCIELCVDARAGARRLDGGASAGGVRAALRAQAPTDCKWGR